MITIIISNGTPIRIPYTQGMHIQDALEASYPDLCFGTNYYGTLGYMVVMINGTDDSPTAGMYWQLSVNGTPTTSGIDNTKLQTGDSINIDHIPYSSIAHPHTLLEVKHQHAQRALSEAYNK